ncbi:MAG: purine-nucleoside phosphorylase [Rhodothermales bacterium]
MPDTLTYPEQVAEAVAYLRSQTDLRPTIGIVLGTGLGALAKEIDVAVSLDYDTLPHFPLSTVESHHGRLLIGHLGGVPVVAMQGRFHLYEGYSAQEITFPIRVFGEFGVETVLISNAAGGMNPLFRRGDLMLTTDHINLQVVNPLVGANVDTWGPRFPDMSEPYDVNLRAQAEQLALDQGIKLQQGVYVSVTGPNLETKAEYRFLRNIGADVVGMSTVPEVIVARHMGLRVLALSVVTDECFPDALEPVSIEDVLAAAAEAEPNLTALTKALVQQLGATA